MGSSAIRQTGAISIIARHALPQSVFGMRIVIQFSTELVTSNIAFASYNTRRFDRLQRERPWYSPLPLDGFAFSFKMKEQKRRLLRQ
jgi:hypothetical protein